MIAVTGANGLLGSYVVRKLAEQNIPFVALKRKNSDTSLLHDVQNINWREADVTDPVALEAALIDVSCVIHTAALVSFNPKDKQKLLDINVGGTKCVVNACLNAGIKKILHVSSVAALGRQKDQTTITEDNKWVESQLNSDYGKSKYLAELEVFRGQEEGLDIVIVNPSVILAAADWNKSSAKLFNYVWQQKPFYIDGSLNYVDVRDVASVIVKLVQSDERGERFIVNAGAITFKTFFDSVASRFQKKSPTKKLSGKTLKFLAFLEQVRSKLTGSEPLVTPQTAKLAGTSFYYDNQRIKKALNYEFQTIEATLDWCCEHYKKIYSSKIE